MFPPQTSTPTRIHSTMMRHRTLSWFILACLLLAGCKTTRHHGSQWIELPEGLYHGDVQNGLPHGRGVLKLKDGSVYRGQFKGGYMDGKGSFTWTNGNHYEGRYREGRRHGKGTYKWASGAVYNGEYKAGVREGRGRMDLPNGKRFTGSYVAGKRHGKGVLKHPDGRLEKGLWKDDQLAIQDPDSTPFFYSQD